MSNAQQKTDASPRKNATASQEKYEKVNPKILQFTFRGEFSSVVFENGENVAKVEGVVKKLAVGDTDIELATDKIGHYQKFITVSTKNFGTIRLVLDDTFGATVWLTPSQKRRLVKIQK